MKLASIFFGALLTLLAVFPAHSGQIVNAEYIHERIRLKTGVNIEYSPSLASAKQAANMKYLLCAIDKANEISPVPSTTNYCGHSLATTQAADVASVADAVARLSNCSAAGYYKQAGSGACGDCGGGYYCAGGGARAACPAGKASAALNATNASACVNCARGTYSAADGSAACSLCVPGTHTVRAGLTVCSDCGGGNYCPGDGTQTKCPAGTASAALNATDASTCSACGPGTYTAAGNTSCGACGYSSYCPAANNRISCGADYITHNPYATSSAECRPMCSGSYALRAQGTISSPPSFSWQANEVFLIAISVARSPKVCAIFGSNVAGSGSVSFASNGAQFIVDMSVAGMNMLYSALMATDCACTSGVSFTTNQIYVYKVN